MDAGHVGVDESGKGDWFGPLVVAAVYVGPEHLAELDGVKDSKKLTDVVALKLALNIRRSCPHATVTLLPDKYNELYAKMGNLNKMLAWAHATAIEKVLELHSADLVISDEFARGGTAVRTRLKERGRAVRFESRVRAESDIAVAAASVLARAEFLSRLNRLSDEAGFALPKGATDVIGAGKKLLCERGASALGHFVKLHFKTTAQVTGS